MKVRAFIKRMGVPVFVAKIVKVTRQAVADWYKSGIPAKHAYDLANRCSMSGVGFQEYTVKFISELETE